MEERSKGKNYLRLNAIKHCTFCILCRLDLQHIRRWWQSFPTHPTSILPSSYLYKISGTAHITSQPRVSRPSPCFLLSLSFPFNHRAGTPQLGTPCLGHLVSYIVRAVSYPTHIPSRKSVSISVGNSMFGSGGSPARH